MDSRERIWRSTSESTGPAWSCSDCKWQVSGGPSSRSLCPARELTRPVRRSTGRQLSTPATGIRRQHQPAAYRPGADIAPRGRRGPGRHRLDHRRPRPAHRRHAHPPARPPHPRRRTRPGQDRGRGAGAGEAAAAIRRLHTARLPDLRKPGEDARQGDPVSARPVPRTSPRRPRRPLPRGRSKRVRSHLLTLPSHTGRGRRMALDAVPDHVPRALDHRRHWRESPGGSSHHPKSPMRPALLLV